MTVTLTARARRGPLATFRALTGPLRLLLITQFCFNVGFYLVVPFLAAHMEHDLRLAGWIIGLVLGVRTFSQQGLFLFGGAIADRFGVKRAIVLGCLVRITGFATLAVATDVAGLICGVVLVGVAAALFSPALESAVSAWAGQVESAGGPTRTEVWGLEGIASKLGSVTGPVLGSVLLVVPFRTTCLVAGGIFGLILIAQVVGLPRGARAGTPEPMLASLTDVAHNKVFLAFAVLHSTYLLTYNQLYLALPVELDRIGAPPASITWFFGLAAVVTIAGQMRLARVALSWGPRRALAVGYAVLACCYLPVAVAAPRTPADGPAAFAPAIAFVMLLHVGQMLTLPVARDAVARLAGERHVGTYLGALSSLGGVAVLIGSGIAGGLLDAAKTPAPDAWVPWAALAVPPTMSALLMPLLLRRHPHPHHESRTA